jgi:hypothetical protein
VKTTPKPSATKKSKGELVGPLLLPPPGLLVGDGDGLAVTEGSVAVDMVGSAIVLRFHVSEKAAKARRKSTQRECGRWVRTRSRMRK